MSVVNNKCATYEMAFLTDNGWTQGIVLYMRSAIVCARLCKIMRMCVCVWGGG